MEDLIKESALKDYEPAEWMGLAKVLHGDRPTHEPPYNPEDPTGKNRPCVWIWDSHFQEWRLYAWKEHDTLEKLTEDEHCWPDSAKMTAPVPELVEQPRSGIRRWQVVLGIIIAVLLVMVFVVYRGGVGAQTNGTPIPTTASVDGLDVPLPAYTPAATPESNPCGSNPAIPDQKYTGYDGRLHYRMDPDNNWIPTPGSVYCVGDPRAVYLMFTQDATVQELAQFDIAHASSFPSEGQTSISGDILYQAVVMWSNRYRNSVRTTDTGAYLKRWNEAWYNAWVQWLTAYQANPDDPAAYTITMPADAPLDLIDKDRLVNETLPEQTVQPAGPTATLTPFQPSSGTNTPEPTNQFPFPTITGVAQTPYVTFTPTPQIIATLAGGGIQIVPSVVSFNDLILKTEAGMQVWNLPGVDSCEIKLQWSEQYQTNFYACWAPSYSNAQYVFELTDTYAIGPAALNAGCSSFNFTDQSAFIYEQRVSRYLQYAFSDQAGINYYLFPAGQTSMGYCMVWPTSTPRPTLAFTPTPLPTNIIPTATDWLSDCNLTYSWDQLLSNPTLVTGSGNSWLGKHNMNDPLDNHYYGDHTGYSILYCITGLPSGFGGKPWNRHTISFMGPIYGGASYEINITGNIWVSEVYP